MSQIQQTSPVLQKKSTFRPEIQGLRALAVLLVAAYHFWLGRVSGGVDIFLLISAFLMTGSFARRLEMGEKIGFRALINYWTHTFKRILPLATLTVLLVLLGTWYFLPAPRWAGIADEAKAVVLYRENWWSIRNMVDYYAADSSEASPLRHFWSLSVQGQIFILWPLIFMFAWLLLKILKRGVRVILTVLFSAVFVGSLAYSVYLTNADQQIAYFSTWTRLWEFALGSLLAVVLPWIKLPVAVKRIAGWAGVIAVLSCGIILDVEGQFPGYTALWPTLAAAAIIFSHGSASKFSAEHFLSHPILLCLGKYSYGLYLIHWPLLVFYLFAADREKASIPAGFALLAVSIAASFVLTNLVEKPLRSMPWLDARAWRSALVAAICSVTVVTASNAWTVHNEKRNTEIIARAETDNPGALMLDQDFTYEGSEDPDYIPLSTQRFEDIPQNPVGCAAETLETYGFSELECRQLTEPDNPSKTVIAAGNSHMEQWADNLRALAQEENWNLQFIQYNNCYLLDPYKREETDCHDWVERTRNYIDAIQPDEVIIIGTISTYENTEEIPADLNQYVEHLDQQGIGLTAIRDNPRFKTTHADCETRSRDLCVFNSVIAETQNPLEHYAQEHSNFATVDMTDIICPEGVCPSTVGNVYVYRDDSHLTSTFAKSAQSYFSDRTTAAMNRRPSPYRE